MFKVFSIFPADAAKIDPVLKDDLVSRQSIAVRDADPLGFPGLGILILIEGDERAVARAVELFQGISKDLSAEREVAIRKAIRDQEDDVAAGVGMIFG
mgnify:FL=1